MSHYSYKPLISQATLIGLTEIRDRLEAFDNKNSGGIIRSAKATYMPGMDPDEPNPLGWNDPR